MITSRVLAAIGICLSLLLATPASAANWNTFKREACTGMGTRQYSAQLMNISGSWEAACRSTSATVQGQFFQAPSRCVNSFGMWGQFDVADNSCAPKWKTPFKKDACSALGKRQYSSQLMGIPAGVDWMVACNATSATVNGQAFSKPDRCKPNAGVWGEFDVPDDACLPRWGAFIPEERCERAGVRLFSAQLLDIPAGVRWEDACGATPATIRGQQFAAPKRCENRGVGGEWGSFEVVVGDEAGSTSCASRWGSFNNACARAGVMQYTAMLSAPAGVSPAEACPITRTGGQGPLPNALPLQCRNSGNTGYFEAPNRCCFPSPTDTPSCAPPARPPTIVAAAQLTQWPGDPTYYSRGQAFSFDVKHGQHNVLRIRENGVDLSPTGCGANCTPTTQTITDTGTRDDHAWTTVSRVSVTPPSAGFPDGQLHNYSLHEESINPAYAGTSQQSADGPLPVMAIRAPCTLKITAPATVQPLDSFNVKWEVNDCKRYSMASGGVVIDQNVFAGAKGQVVKTATVTVPMQTGVWAFTLSGQNASRGESNDEFRTLVACQGAPGGALQVFNFSAQCGSSCTAVSQVACNAASAKFLVERNFGNCTVVQNGTCR